MADMTKKLAGHPTFEPGESIIEAVWGLGKGFLRAADIAGGSANKLIGGTNYSNEYSQAVGDRNEDGFGAQVDGNGVLALTSRRLLFYKKATVSGTPKAITAEIGAEHVASASYEKPILTVTFDDGSATGLHVPRNQKPDAFVQAISEAGTAG